mmetsp:Transcript_27747/g.44073  ORF Transcript_27747/g.44073 Transcript_27747/m.44073 type:complete len:222 (-) Transcript_27747:1180-1845(-)
MGPIHSTHVTLIFSLNDRGVIFNSFAKYTRRCPCLTLCVVYPLILYICSYRATGLRFGYRLAGWMSLRRWLWDFRMLYFWSLLAFNCFRRLSLGCPGLILRVVYPLFTCIFSYRAVGVRFDLHLRLARLMSLWRCLRRWLQDFLELCLRRWLQDFLRLCVWSRLVFNACYFRRISLGFYDCFLFESNLCFFFILIHIQFVYSLRIRLGIGRFWRACIDIYH